MREQHAGLPPALLAELNAFLADNIGVYFACERLADLERGIRAAAREMGHDVEACVRSLLQSPLTRRQIDVLAHHLTVGETYFFREKESLTALEDHILGPLVRARAQSERRLRIWSAGCSTGEEPYSIAIALARTIPDIAGWDVSILATDINPHALRKASAGVYSDWSFRNALPDFKNAYFKRTVDGRWEIAARIKSLVKFDYLNLAQDCYPSAGNGTHELDIVFCRNVLMYFEPAHARKVLLNLTRSLVEGGWLFLNPVEIPHLASPQLVPVNFTGVTLHRKDSRAANAAQALPTAYPDMPANSRMAPSPRDLSVVEAPRPAAETRRSARDFIAPAAADATAQTAHGQAEASYEQGRYANAVRELLEILRGAPTDAAAMGLLARAYANAGNLSEASQWCAKAIEVDKLNAGWRYLLATILQEQGLADDAAAALRRALYLDDNHALAHYALGNLIRRQGRPDDAALHFRNALTILSGYPQQQVLPESEGITAGRLAEMIRSSVSSAAGA